MTLEVHFCAKHYIDYYHFSESSKTIKLFNHYICIGSFAVVLIIFQNCNFTIPVIVYYGYSIMRFHHRPRLIYHLLMTLNLNVNRSCELAKHSNFKIISLILNTY